MNGGIDQQELEDTLSWLLEASSADDCPYGHGTGIEYAVLIVKDHMDEERQDRIRGKVMDHSRIRLEKHRGES